MASSDLLAPQRAPDTEAMGRPVAAPDAARQRPVFCVSHVYGHHAAASGYHHLAQYVGALLTPSRGVKLAGETLVRLPAKIAAWLGGVYEYNRHSVTGEIALALRFLSQREGIFHFLYGEKGYRYSGWLNGRRQNVLIGSFHYPPSRFDAMVSPKRHLRRLEHAVAVSTNQLEMLERYVGAGKVSFVPHGIDTDYWRPLARRTQNGLRRCVFAGVHMRDYATLDAAIRLVRSAREDVEFTLLCSNQACQSIAASKGVRWLRRTTDEEYISAIRESDVMFLPLTDSTAVNSVLEALACGVPVITSAGGVEDYLTAECARVHPVGDARAMADSLLELLDDESQLGDMRAAARRRALALDWKHIAAQMASIYQRFPYTVT
jgi:glycosyltransferase involved in cell wall biosynthesis